MTGAACGIGRATAQRLAHEGMRVVLADIDAPLLKSVTDDLSGAGHDVVAVPTDVSSVQAIEALRDAALDAFGAVHAWRGIMADRVAAMGDGVLHHGFGG